MPFFSNIISFLFFTTLSLSLQIHARDSPFFFSKVTHANTDIDGKEIASTTSPNKEEPMFIPESDNSYGLYGHETTYQPYKSESEEDMRKFPSNQNDFSSSSNKDSSTYGENQNEELGSTKYTEEYNSLSNQKEKNHKYRYYYNNNNNNAARSSSYGGDQREGMSDTRFMDGGKYFYGVGSHQKYDPTFYGDSTRGPKSKSWENNSYENNDAMDGYLQNQEFEGNKDDEFEP